MATEKDTPDPPPVWARGDAFPEAPQGWGWVDAKGKTHPCDSPEKLMDAIRGDRDGSVNLVWTQENPRMILPEELPGTGDALRAARERWTRDDLEDVKHKLRWFGMACVGFGGWAFYQGLVRAGNPAGFPERLNFAARTVLSSGQSGLALLMFLIFAFIPWYQARKRRRELGEWDDARIAATVPAMRFETWLAWQKAPTTRILLALMTVVGLAQLFCHVRTAGWDSLIAVFQNWDGIAEAGLVKGRYLQGEWWRLFTAPFLHGNIVHFLMNASALIYLGRRLEVFARWPHLPMVFLFSACAGGEASARFVAAPSVGASGGLMGWLGFLLVFETLHKSLVPLSARRRLAAGVFLTALIGLVGYRYIDNAAHAGGLLAGMSYAAIVFPKSSSTERPNSTVADRIAGGACLVVLAASAFLAVSRIIGG